MFGRNVTAQDMGSNPQNDNKKNRRWVKSYVKYSHLPGIFPRLREIGAKFGHFAFLLAQIYGAVRLIPAAHPVLNPSNIGKFGFRDVLGAASQNLVLSWKNIDQILVFVAVLMGLITLALQLLFTVLAAITSTAFAQTASFFTTPNEQTDLALRFLEQTFGDIDIFSDNSFSHDGVAPGNEVFIALHEMLGFYSQVMMVFAAIIVVYFVITVLAEAAQTGTPFGRRFNSVWAPIRLVVALGLLVPLGNGLNSAQYITFYVAKMGSGFATQTWMVFADAVLDTNGTGYQIVVDTQPDSMRPAIDRILVAETCMAARNRLEGLYSYGSSARVVREYYMTKNTNRGTRSSGLAPFNNFASANSARVAGSYDTINIVWAAQGLSASQKKIAANQCGKVTLSFTNEAANLSGFFGTIPAAEEAIGDAIRDLEVSILGTIQLAFDGFTNNGTASLLADAYLEPGSPYNTLAEVQSAVASVNADISSIYNDVDAAVVSELSNVYNVLKVASLESMHAFAEAGGWVTAGVYYARIGQINQAYYDVAQTARTSVRYNSPGPILNDLGETFGFAGSNGFLGFGGDSDEISQARAFVAEVVQSVVENHISPASLAAPPANAITEPDDLLERIANLDFGAVLAYLFQLDRLSELVARPTLDPMTKLQSVGSDMASRSMIAISAAIAARLAGTAASGVPVVGGLGKAAGVGASLLMTIAMVGFGIGFLLLYLFPLFPFIYFFFAVVAWVLEIFEAIIAMPLWALGHLRIEGDGFFGPGALNGYLLLFSILLRPIFIVFGLIAGYITFGSGTFLLQTMFAELIRVQNVVELAGISDLVYAILFAYFVYQLGVMCFKMVDSVPQQIIRWMGQNAQTFNDNRKDLSDNSTGFIVGASAVASQISNARG